MEPSVASNNARLQQLAVQETYWDFTNSSTMSTMPRSYFAQRELEEAYCVGLIPRTRALPFFLLCVLCLVLLFFPADADVPFYTPHMDGVLLVDVGQWQDIARGTILLSTITLVSFAWSSKRSRFVDYERLFLATLSVSVFVLPLTQKWRAVAFHLWLSGARDCRPDSCRNAACTQQVGDLMLCMSLALAQLSIILLPRARWSWVVSAAANIGYAAFTIPFGGSPAEGKPNDGTYLLTLPCMAILLGIGSIAWVAQLCLEVSLRTGWLQYHRLGALHAERERLERDFAATAYHELRNPLSGTVGYLRFSHEALVSLQHQASTVGAVPNSPDSLHAVIDSQAAAHRELLEHVSNALICCESTLVNLRSLTSLYKIEAHPNLKLEPKPTLLRQLLRETCIVSPPLFVGGTRLLLSLPSADDFRAAGLGDDGNVLVDKAPLSQILTNLMHNSARFTSGEGAFICLSCRILPHQGNE